MKMAFAQASFTGYIVYFNKGVSDEDMTKIKDAIRNNGEISLTPLF
jgi:hypothetical protein